MKANGGPAELKIDRVEPDGIHLTVAAQCGGDVVIMAAYPYPAQMLPVPPANAGRGPCAVRVYTQRDWLLLRETQREREISSALATVRDQIRHDQYFGRIPYAMASELLLKSLAAALPDGPSWS